MSGWLPWLAAAAILGTVPLLVRWGRRHARGSAGGAMLMLGLAFGHLFDPARAEATEALLKRREEGRQEAQAGEKGPGKTQC